MCFFRDSVEVNKDLLMLSAVGSEIFFCEADRWCSASAGHAALEAGRSTRYMRPSQPAAGWRIGTNGVSFFPQDRHCEEARCELVKSP